MEIDDEIVRKVVEAHNLKPQKIDSNKMLKEHNNEQYLWKWAKHLLDMLDTSRREDMRVQTVVGVLREFQALEAAINNDLRSCGVLVRETGGDAPAGAGHPTGEETG